MNSLLLNHELLRAIQIEERDEFIVAKPQTLKSNPYRGQAMWQRPTNMLSKVNWDASLNVQVGIGVIARNSEGDILACLCSSFQAGVKPAMAEVLALRRAMFFC